MSLKIIRAVKNDAKQIHDLVLSAFARYASEVGFVVAALKESEEDIIADIENKNVFIAVSDNKVVGSIRYEKIKNIAYISRFSASANTKIDNIGKSLIDYVKEECSASGIDAICLHTSTKLTGLVRFYYKCGFFVFDINRDRGYPRGLFVCPLTDRESDYVALTERY